MPEENVSRMPLGRTRKIDTGTCLPPRPPGERDVEIAVAVEHGVVDLMQTGGEERRRCPPPRAASIRRRREWRRWPPSMPGGHVMPSSPPATRTPHARARTPPMDTSGSVAVGRPELREALECDATAFNRPARGDCDPAGIEGMSLLGP